MQATSQAKNTRDDKSLRFDVFCQPSPKQQPRNVLLTLSASCMNCSSQNPSWFFPPWHYMVHDFTKTATTARDSSSQVVSNLWDLYFSLPSLPHQTTLPAAVHESDPTQIIGQAKLSHANPSSHAMQTRGPRPAAATSLNSLSLPSAATTMPDGSHGSHSPRGTTHDVPAPPSDKHQPETKLTLASEASNRIVCAPELTTSPLAVVSGFEGYHSSSSHSKASSATCAVAHSQLQNTSHGLRHAAELSPKSAASFIHDPILACSLLAAVFGFTTWPNLSQPPSTSQTAPKTTSLSTDTAAASLLQLSLSQMQQTDITFAARPLTAVFDI